MLFIHCSTALIPSSVPSPNGFNHADRRSISLPCNILASKSLLLLRSDAFSVLMWNDIRNKIIKNQTSHLFSTSLLLIHSPLVPISLGFHPFKQIYLISHPSPNSQSTVVAYFSSLDSSWSSSLLQFLLLHPSLSSILLHSYSMSLHLPSSDSTRSSVCSRTNWTERQRARFGRSPCKEWWCNFLRIRWCIVVGRLSLL